MHTRIRVLSSVFMEHVFDFAIYPSKIYGKFKSHILTYSKFHDTDVNTFLETGLLWKICIFIGKTSESVMRNGEWWAAFLAWHSDFGCIWIVWKRRNKWRLEKGRLKLNEFAVIVFFPLCLCCYDSIGYKIPPQIYSQQG